MKFVCNRQWEKLLCPFHYFGITDLEVDGHVIDDDDLKMCKILQSWFVMTRVQYIMQQIEYYGYSGDRVRGDLCFAAARKKRKLYLVKFNMRGLRTIVLTGDSSRMKEKMLYYVWSKMSRRMHLIIFLRLTYLMKVLTSRQ